MTAAEERFPLFLLGAAALATALFVLHSEPVGLIAPGPGAFFDEWLYHGVFVAGAFTCFWRAAAIEGDRAAWAALGSAIALWGAADIYWSVALADDASPPYPSIADALWLSSYLPFYAAVVLYLRSRLHRPHLSMWLDGAIGALAVGAVARGDPGSGVDRPHRRRLRHSCDEPRLPAGRHPVAPVHGRGVGSDP